jgi:hypothetical protein
MKLSGKILEDAYYFKFMIAGDNYNSINISVIDVLEKKKLPVQIDKSSKDSPIKFFIVSYSQLKKSGEPWCLEISWLWEEMLEKDTGYIAMPNFYAKRVSMLRQIFIPCEEQTFDKVSIYKYNVNMEEPIFLFDVLKESECFKYEITNPDSYTDYLLYYENI